MKGILKNVVKCAKGEEEVMDMKGANIKGIISNVPKSAERGRREQGHEGDHQQGAPERPGGGRGEQGHERGQHEGDPPPPPGRSRPRS